MCAGWIVRSNPDCDAASLSGSLKDEIGGAITGCVARSMASWLIKHSICLLVVGSCWLFVCTNSSLLSLILQAGLLLDAVLHRGARLLLLLSASRRLLALSTDASQTLQRGLGFRLRTHPPTIRLFSGGSFGFLGLFNLFLAHTNVFYGRTIGADQKEHTLSD